MPKRIQQLDTAANRRLFDMLFRHQVYLEGVKSAFVQDYADVLNKLYAEFGKYLSQNRYDTIDQFRKDELQTFIVRFTRAQTKFYSLYTERVIKILRDFLAVDLDLHKEIYQEATAKTPVQANQVLKPQITGDEYAALPNVLQQDYERVTGKDESSSQGHAVYRLTERYQANQNASGIYGVGIVAGTEDSNNRLWATITNQPVPASGQMPLAMLTDFGKIAAVAIYHTIRKGYANAWTNEQLRLALLGRGPNYEGGLLKRFRDQHTAVTNTLVQHTSAEIGASVASVYFERYQWVSVMDNKTTPICIARNGVVYIFGKGPLPPAHYNCRSKIVPVSNETILHDIPDSFYAWLVTQPEWILSDMLGAKRAKEIKAGSMSATKFGDVATVQPLTLAEFQAKAKYILGE